MMRYQGNNKFMMQLDIIDNSILEEIENLGIWEFLSK